MENKKSIYTKQYISHLEQENLELKVMNAKLHKDYLCEKLKNSEMQRQIKKLLNQNIVLRMQNK